MPRTRTTVVAAAAVAAALIVAAAGCGGSSSNTTQKPIGANKTVTIGVLTDMTGLAGSTDQWVVEGVKAGVVAAARAGYDLKFTVADTATNPAGTLPAAQKLVQQNNAVAVIANSVLTFAAAPYLTKANVPVIGAAQDGPEWQTAKNMFSVYGALHSEKVTSTEGEFFKMLGVTRVAALGYGISPISKQAAEATGVSAQASGLQAPYINANFPFGSTNVQPVALAMKHAGVDGVHSATVSATTFALITALRNLGVHIKAPMMSTGYGNELLDAGPATLQAAEGFYFLLAFQPMEMNTPATRQFAADLKSAGITKAPGYAMYNGYVSVLMLIDALKAAGDNPTRASVLTALSNMHAFTANGLYGDHKLDPNNRTDYVSGVDQCQYFVQMKSGKFVLVPGADPLCGHVIPGKTVS